MKQHFKLFGDGITLLPLKVSYSKRASHQISSHVLRILLEELLGYEDVVLVPDDSGLFVNKALQKISGCSNHRYCVWIYSLTATACCCSESLHFVFSSYNPCLNNFYILKWMQHLFRDSIQLS